MGFLANGDFNFPLDWAAYWAKHFYMWSFQTGTPNPDGIIRFPGRVFNFLVFGLLGHEAVGYFYIFSTLLFAFIAFFYFCRYFLEVKQRSICLLGALFFAINPIFLGNLAKVGLVLAAAMLPLCLIAIKVTFARQRLRYLLWAILLLNISLLHPYTFSVNFAVAGIYFVYKAWHSRQFVARNRFKFAVIGLVAVLLNAYLVLPIASMGTVSKDVISSSVTPTHTDYTALVNISNTGDVLTGLSLAKNVFLDFSFYNDGYRVFYLIGTFALYIILIGLYLTDQQRLRRPDRRQLPIFFGAFLVLIALATTNFLHIDELIKMLIGLPGGWAFRSPLKWQLYIPLALFSILVILLNNLKQPRQRKLVIVSLLISFVLTNGYVSYSVYKMILTPRHFNSFASLQQMELSHKTLLFVNNSECQKFMPYNSPVLTELNQVFTSKDLEVKRVWEDETATVNLSGFDFVMTCKGQEANRLAEAYGFKQAQSYAHNSLQLYANSQPQAAVSTLSNVYALSSLNSLDGKYAFVASRLTKPFAYLPASSQTPATKLADVFESVSKNDLTPGKLTAKANLSTGDNSLYAQPNDEPVYYSLADKTLNFSSKPQAGMQLLAEPNQPATLPLKNENLSINYLDDQYDFSNIIQNPSFENGLWQKDVKDCFAYDDYPSIGMKQIKSDHTDGHQALELDAISHIACTGPASIKVNPGEHYLIDFDYRSLGQQSAGYYVSFDGSTLPATNQRLQATNSNWQHFSTIVTVPSNADRLRLLLYGYPEDGFKTGRARYDAVQVSKVPDVKNRFYVVTSPSKLQKPANINYKLINPTKKLVNITGATTPFYLTTNDSYHSLWRLSVAGQKPSSLKSRHVALNGISNGWFIEPTTLCQQVSGCHKNPDGSYNFAVAIEFAPQHWFYIGLAVSGLTLLGCVTFLLMTRDKGRNIWQLKR
jgi:hypothetical protein